eukprot:1017002-Pleurochrysis_carterae.AAC.1
MVRANAMGKAGPSKDQLTSTSLEGMLQASASRRRYRAERRSSIGAGTGTAAESVSPPLSVIWLQSFAVEQEESLVASCTLFPSRAQWLSTLASQLWRLSPSLAGFIPSTTLVIPLWFVCEGDLATRAIGAGVARLLFLL